MTITYYGGADCSPLTMTTQERKRRVARWQRRYPNLGAWLSAHIGEGAGQVLQQPEITYYMTAHCACWTGGKAPCQPEDIITEAEFLAWWGMPPRQTTTASDLTYPPKPENWRENKPPTKGEAIRKIKKEMARLGVSLADLGAGATPPDNGSGNGNSKPLLDWRAAGWV